MDFIRNEADCSGRGSSLEKNVSAKAAQPFNAEREVKLMVFLKAVFLRFRKDAITEDFCIVAVEGAPSSWVSLPLMRNCGALPVVIWRSEAPLRTSSFSSSCRFAIIHNTPHATAMISQKRIRWLPVESFPYAFAVMRIRVNCQCLYKKITW